MKYPLFAPRDPKEKYQVRFWTHPSKYEAFKSKCDALNLHYGDVLQDFLVWFSKEYRQTELDQQTPHTTGIKFVEDPNVHEGRVHIRDASGKLVGAIVVGGFKCNKCGVLDHASDQHECDTTGKQEGESI